VAPQFSGPAGDRRDPQRLGGVFDSWVSGNGYSRDLAVNGLLERWVDVVGEHIAEHVVVAEFRPAPGGGTVVLQAESQPWVLQMRYMRDRLLVRIAEEVGPGLVGTIDVRGPAARSTPGRLRVRTGRRSPRV
jgi:predicted nucleic acid-binding Zn ribbon protein